MPRFRIDRTCPRVVSIATAGRTVLARCHVAERWVSRLVGLLGTPDLTADEGLWLGPCRSVHTWGMRIAISCAFVDADGRVLRIVDPLPPWRTAAARGAVAVVEARAGALTALAVGDTLVLGPPAS